MLLGAEQGVTVDTFVSVLNLVLAAVTVAGFVAAVLVVRVTQKRAEEWKDLATSRGEVVDDLRSSIGELREEVSELKGAIRALESVKAQEIAERVAEHLIDLFGNSNLRVPNE